SRGARVFSYTPVSPLPRDRPKPDPRRSVLCGTVPRITPGGCWPPPCPVEPGRSSAGTQRALTRPPDRLIHTSSLSANNAEVCVQPPAPGCAQGVGITL